MSTDGGAGPRAAEARADRGATIGVVGLGLVGGSLAQALLAAGHPVLGVDHDPCNARLAARAGVGVCADLAALAAAMPTDGVVMLAVPLAAVQPVAAALLPGLGPDVLVLHAAGLQRGEATGLDGAQQARVIGTHPMAGSHAAGFGAARADLFEGATVWAEDRADERTRARIGAVWAAAGAGTVRYAPAERHDAMMAWTSHLPQLAATALAATLADAGVPAAVGGAGLRDTTRLAASPAGLWGDLLAAAPPETDAALAALEATVGALRAALTAGDRGAVQATWTRARAWRGTS